MPKFKLIEHTTDIGLTAYSRTLAQAFANAAYDMFSIMAELWKRSMGIAGGYLKGIRKACECQG